MGIWLLEIDASGETECEETLEHNFIDFVLDPDEEEDPNWTSDESSSESPELQFVQIKEGGGNLCVMVWGNTVLPGSCDGSSWSFEWTRKDVGTQSDVHALGYTFSHEYDYNAKTKLNLEVSGESASGTLKGNASTRDAYIESDMWAQAVGVPDGRMPVGNWLRTRSTDEEGNVTVSPTKNTRPNSECAASECTLTAEESCQDADRTVRAYYYAFAEDADYSGIRANSQAGGFPQQQGGGGGGGGQ